MPRTIGVWRRFLFLTWVAASLLPGLATAQEGAAVRISPPLTDRFPILTVYVSLTDSTGRRIAGQASPSFHVLEDGAPAASPIVEEVPVGTRQVVVINTVPGMRLQDSSGRSRFDYVRRALIDGWQMPAAAPFGTDDLTLLTSDGTLAAHSPSAAELASSLDGANPSFEGGTADFALLLQALDFLSDPAPRPGMPSIVLFFTPLIQPGSATSLANVISRASQVHARIFPILVAPPDSAELPETADLHRLAETTGGRFQLFDPLLGLTSLAEQVLDERTQYELTYTSAVNTTGNHTIQIQVTAGETQVLSNSEGFEIDVRPPEAAFIDPPNEIVRQSEDPSLASPELLPASQALRLLVAFPDGHPRPLASSHLIVDGQIAVQRAQAPFDLLEWDLSGYGETASHTLQAVVEDTLGLQAVTVEVPVTVRVVSPPRGLAALRGALGPLTAALAILVAGIVLAVSMISIGRQRSAHQKEARPAGAQRKSPLKRAGLRRAGELEPAEAFLLPVEPDGSFPEAVPLTGVDVTLGRDASLAAVVLDDPSVAAMHARLIRQAGGEYLIRDQGSIAGTWVNHEPVPAQGRRLRHGDLLHVGRMAFRFQLAVPPPPAEVRIRPAVPARPVLPLTADAPSKPEVARQGRRGPRALPKSGPRSLPQAPRRNPRDREGEP